MSKDSTLEEKKAVIKDISAVVTEELAKGKNKEDIIKELISYEWSERSAREFVNNIEKYVESPGGQRQIIASKYEDHMLYGALLAIGGTIITILSYSLAASSPVGGPYIITTGAIIFGIIYFLIGLSGWLKYRD